MAPPKQNDVLATLQTVAANTGYVAWKLAKSTGNAAWIASTSLLVLVVPLIVEMDREQVMTEFENQAAGALAGKP